VEGCARGLVLLGTTREVVFKLGYDTAVKRTAQVQVCNVAAVPSCFVPGMDLLVTQHGCLSCRVSVYLNAENGKA
jgi:hypothetical protein